MSHVRKYGFYILQIILIFIYLIYLYSFFFVNKDKGGLKNEFKLLETQPQSKILFQSSIEA